MDKPIVFMYSGQGSQYYQMGKTLFGQHPEFKSEMTRLDKQVREIIGTSVADEVYSSNRAFSEPFRHTLHTHLSIFMVECVLTKVLMDRGVVPAAVAGSSLGEFAAGVAAGVWSRDTALQAVVKQAELLGTHCEAGGMLAILHDPGLYHSADELYRNCELVSVNNEAHFVVSGSRDKIDKVERYLKSRKITTVNLPVEQGFHSELIDPAAGEYTDYLKGVRMKEPEIPFISSLTGKRVRKLEQDHFWQAVRKPILFSEAAGFMQDEIEDGVYLDLGPSGTLAGFMKKLWKPGAASVSLPILTPFHQDKQSLDHIIATYANETKLFMKKENDPMLVYVFPGQGSQIKGMGAELFDQFPQIVKQADSILGYSIKDLCLTNSGNRLNLTQYTQPALYTVNALMYMQSVQTSGIKPDIVAGHSLGEYNALLAAEAFDFATGLKLVQKRGELMSQAVGGAMAAVIGLDEPGVAQVLTDSGLDRIDLANLNSTKQLVISGLKDDIDSAQPVFEAIEGVRYVPLNVSGAFHSRYMQPAKQQFEEFIRTFAFGELTIPVISNVSARPYRNSDLIDNLLNQITHSVKWCETVQVLMGFEHSDIKEIGPGMVLTRLVEKIRAEAQPIPITLQTEKEAEVVAETTSESRVMVEETATETARQLAPAAQDVLPELAMQLPPLFTAESLGSSEFKQDYKVKYAYYAGSMYHGIASRELVVKMGKAGMMAFLGTGGLTFEDIEKDIHLIQKELAAGQAYGMNLLHSPYKPEREEQQADLFMKHGVRNIEASAFMSITPALIKFRAHGLRKSPDGTVATDNRIIAKVSRPEVAEAFLSPAPEYLVEAMLKERKITAEQAQMLKQVPMADDLCLEADSAGHTDRGVAYVLMSAIAKLRDEMISKHGYRKKVRIGAAGGIGAPEAAAAAIVLGADFLVTGSINQCTVEAGTSDEVKDLLQQINIQDTAYAPAGDMFEMGAQVQVAKRGVFFPARANKLYELYRQHNSIADISEKDKKQIQERYFKRSFEEVYEEVKQYQPPGEIEKAEQNAKHKMALIFKWYFGYSSRLALQGAPGEQVDYQIHCGPAMGAFNQWVKGTDVEHWRNRHVDAIGKMLLTETARLLNTRFQRV